MTEQHRKLAAYAICRRDDEVLLAHYVSQDGRRKHWTLPGGKVEHAEDPVSTVVREVEEETGYHVETEALLGVDSRNFEADWETTVDVHSVGVFYAVRIVGGELRDEINGSTDTAAWVPMAAVPSLNRSTVVDVGLEMERVRPADGHVASVPPGGLLRH